MHWLDWSIIGIYIAFTTIIGLLFTRRAGGNVAEYFVAGRNLPWWLAGTSLAATSFAADTPLFVAGLITTMGIAGNWLWWNQVFAWALAIVFFAPLWRRSGVITDAEFIEIRYGGRTAALLRGFRAFYMSFIYSTFTVAWVMLAMQKIVQATIAPPAWAEGLQQYTERALGFESGSVDVWKWTVLLGLFLVATLYTTLSGLWGIVVTDLIQFAIAMGGAILFAAYAVDSVGGIAELRSKLLAEYGPERVENIYSFFPAMDSPWMPVATFLVYLSVPWWGDCNGFAAQRMFSTRSERDSRLAVIWYSVAHFVLRPWPWILVGMVAMVYYPHLEDPESGYPKLLMAILPLGMKGVLIASLLAAFMSTVDTHLNWNASYLVMDIYKRFIAPDANEAQCVRISRCAVVGFAALAIVFAYFMTSIKQAVVILFGLQSGINLVMMLRWFWWRINAWSEISAMIASLLVTITLQIGGKYFGFHLSDIATILLPVLVTTPIWISVTLLTQPVAPEHLERFYREIRPPSTFWRPIAARCPEHGIREPIGRILFRWLTSALCIYASMFAIGKMLLMEWGDAAIAIGIGIISAVVLWKASQETNNALAA